MFIHRNRGTFAGVHRHTANRLDKVDLRVGHHDFHGQRQTAFRSCAGDVEVVLRVHDEHIGLRARLDTAAKHRFDIIDRDICSQTRFFSVAVDTTSHVGSQLVSSRAARVVTATHTVRVFDVIVSDLSRVGGVSFARIISHTLQLTSHSVLDDAVQIEFTKRTGSVSSAVQLSNIDAVDIRPHAR